MQNNITERKNLLTIGQASEYLGVSVDTLRRWEKKGRIEPYRSPGGHRHYEKQDLDKLFNKRYTRDEPTIRRASTKDEEPAAQENKEPTILEEQELKQKQKEEAETEPVEPHIIGIPSWRAIKTEPEPQPQPIQNEQEKREESTVPLERPVREIKIPEAVRVQVTKREAVVSPSEAYYRQQSVSVLTPAPIAAPQQEKLTPPPRQQDTPKEIQSNNSSYFRENKKIIIYSMITIGVILLITGWYFAWVASQKVLSPIP